MSSGIERLREHVDECDGCDGDSPALERIDAVLRNSEPPLDPTALSRQAFVAARQAMVQATSAADWRQVAAAVVVALLPLPLILLYDAMLLRLLHAAASSVFSGTMATYLVFTYASTLLFLFAMSYAAIPVLMSRRRPRLPTPA